MEMRKLGRSGLSIAPLMVGGNVFGWTADEATSFKLLDAFVEAGVNAIDTADVYSRFVPGHTGGESETVIGKWLKQSGKRQRVVIATKLGMDMGEGKNGLSRAYMMRAVEASHTRLQTDVIDLYQSHRDDEATPLEETLAAFGDLIKQGKVRAIGASNYTAPRLKAALEVSARNSLPRFETLQPLYNLHDRGQFEGPLQDLCVSENVSAITYFSLASGFLTGKYRSEADFSKSPRGMRMKQYFTPRGFAILRALDEVAAQTKATPAQVALAWLMAKPAVAAPIASATSLEQLADLVEAVRLSLSPAHVTALDEASADATSPA
jgi:aryl-alcohol dehydrogenase-like predicted oxidoreductase